MYCSNCGTEASHNRNYCSKCGADLQSSAALSAHGGDNRNDSTGYIAMALGFSVCGGIIALAVAAVKMAQLGVDGFGIGVFALACASIIIGIASMLVNLMMKLNGVADDDKHPIRMRRNAAPNNSTVTQRALDEHRELVPPFSSITDRTTKIFEPARKQESGNL